MILAAWDDKRVRPGWVGKTVLDLAAHEVEGVSVLVVQSLVRDGNEESMAPVFLVPCIVTQFSRVKKLSVSEETFQV